MEYFLIQRNNEPFIPLHVSRREVAVHFMQHLQRVRNEKYARLDVISINQTRYEEEVNRFPSTHIVSLDLLAVERQKGKAMGPYYENRYPSPDWHTPEFLDFARLRWEQRRKHIYYCPLHNHEFLFFRKEGPQDDLGCQSCFHYFAQLQPPDCWYVAVTSRPSMFPAFFPSSAEQKAELLARTTNTPPHECLCAGPVSYLEAMNGFASFLCPSSFPQVGHLN